QEVIAVAISVCAVRKTASALIGSGICSLPEARCRTRRRRMTSTLFWAGFSLVTFGGPWINEASVVKTVNNQARSITQRHGALLDRDVKSSEKNDVRGEFRSPIPLVGFGRSLITRGFYRSISHNCVVLVVFRQGTVEFNASAKRLNRLVTRMRKGGRRFESDPGSAIAERKVGRMIELKRRCQIEACTRIHNRLVVDVRLREDGRELEDGASRASRADGRKGDCLPVRGSADGDFVPHGESICIANFDTGSTDARICREVRAVCLRADARDRNGFNSMADAVDIQSNLVANRDVVYGRYLNIGRSRRGVRFQVALRAWLADRRNCGDFVMLYRFCNGGIGGAVTESNFFSHGESGSACNRHIRRANGNRDYRTIRKRLPHRRAVTGCRTEASNFACLGGQACVNRDGITDRHAGGASDRNVAIAGVCGGREPGVSKPEQVKAAGRELCSRGNLYGREDCLLCRMLRQGPVGNVRASRAGVIEFDKGVGCVVRRSRANAKFVDLDWSDVANFLSNGLNQLLAARRVRPLRFANQVAVECRCSRSDFESCIHARTGRDRIRKSL